MPDSLLGRLFGRAAGQGDDPKLLAAAEAGEWETVLALARRAMRRRRATPEVLVLAARARIESANDAAAFGEAAGWLDQALASAPRDAEALYLRGLVEYLGGRPLDAVPWWRRAIESDPGNAAVRDALVKVWVAAGELPDWGVAIVESTLLDGDG